MTLPTLSPQDESIVLSSSDPGLTLTSKKKVTAHLENADLLTVPLNGVLDKTQSQEISGVSTLNNDTRSPTSTNGMNSSYTEELATSSTPSTSPLALEIKNNISLPSEEPAATSTTTMTTKTPNTLDSAPSSLTNGNYSETIDSPRSTVNGVSSIATHSKESSDVHSSINNPSLVANMHQVDVSAEATDDASPNLNLNTPPESPKSRHHRFHLHHNDHQKDVLVADELHPGNDSTLPHDIPATLQNQGLASETSQPASPPSQSQNKDKGKGKKKAQFFNPNIFRNTSSRSLSLADPDSAIDESTDPSPVNGSSPLKKSTKYGEHDSHSRKTLSHLHKSRSKSDAGLHEGADLQTTRSRLRSRSRHSDEHDPRKTDGTETSDNLPESHSDTELDHIKSGSSPTSASPKTEFKRRRNFLPRYSTFSAANGSFAGGAAATHANRHQHNLQRQPSDSENPEAEASGEHPQRFSRRHTLFSIDYNPPSMAIDWKDVKNALRRFKKKKQEERTDDQVLEDDTALISELASGIPSAMIIPMSFLKDDRGIPRIPVLLHHVKASVNDITQKPNEKNRKYSIELSYGSGSTGLNWSIVREYKDLIAMHSRLKVLSFQNVFSTKLQLPKFPSRHHIADHMLKERYQQDRLARHGRTASIITPIHSENATAAQTPGSAPVGTSSHASTPNNAPPHSAPATSAAHSQNHHNTRSNYLSTIADEQPSRRSASSERSASILTLGSDASENSHRIFRRIHRTASITSNLHAVHRPSFIGGHGNLQENEEERDAFIERLRAAVEKYILELLREMRFRPEANRVFQFLELSNMSIRLAPENSYHGKEGYLILRSSAASMGWRVSHWKPNELSLMIDRHTSRWYLVRESYIVCVNDISSANVSEVFLVDPDFSITSGSSAANAPPPQEKEETTDKSHQGFTFQVENGERKMKLVATSQRQLSLWVDSINHMKEGSIWSKPHRFHSFAPVRQNVQARWFVDARDYFWTVSVALDMAKDVIYIHDWWLSPELYLRRPPDGNQEWRLDRVLKRKAEEGVKIFVIVYRNVGQTVPIDSSWTKHSLLDLHPNIYLMRSPNQLLQNTYFWAHHEKLCLIDHTIGFLGGIDLCFGRWDTAEHVLVDDSPVAFYDPNKKNEFKGPTQIWPGKDYSNPRQRDFYSLDKPYEDMYDRNETPRMPWHDVHMMVTGQAARDLVRHFVQRWNYLIRQKRPSRYTPLLLPPADLTPIQLQSLHLEGTCEVQILRSSCFWSLGIKKPEHSIQNAYLKAIESSEHFVYIENQFFISSTYYEGTEIQNRIGDALVERIIRAHRNNEDWKCVVVIPLMPGFESEIDEKNGLSVRMIMQFQYLTISHGPNSIFGKLFKQNINPEDYIQFFSLRKWGKIGPKKQLVTEQLYIHCKTMIVDDRIAIIGSANINERSMRGNRDSEVASIIRDTDTIESVMAGKPYRVGRFPHTLRMRLMREHVGIDIDQLEMIDHLVDRELSSATLKMMDPHEAGIMEFSNGIDSSGLPRASSFPTDDRPQRLELHSFNHLAGVENIGLRDKKPLSNDSRVQGNETHRLDVEGLGFDKFRKREAMEHMGVVMTTMAPTDADSMEGIVHKYFEQMMDDVGLDAMLSNVTEIKRRLYYYLQTRNWRKETNTFDDISLVANGGKPLSMHFFPQNGYADDNVFQFRDLDDYSGSLSMDSNGSPVHTPANSPPGATQHNFNIQAHATTGDSLPPQFFSPIDPYSFQDPVSPDFYYDMWERVADQNTLLYREVFHCQPDDEVTSWKQYIEFKELFKRFAENQGQNVPEDIFEINIPETQRSEYEMEVLSAMSSNDMTHAPGAGVEVQQNEEENEGEEEGLSNEEAANRRREREAAQREAEEQARIEREKYQDMLRRRRQNRRSSRNVLTADDVFQPSIAERVVQGVRGNLVFFPTQWLAHELESGNWQHAIDHLPPIEIYD